MTPKYNLKFEVAELPLFHGKTLILIYYYQIIFFKPAKPVVHRVARVQIPNLASAVSEFDKVL